MQEAVSVDASEVVKKPEVVVFEVRAKLVGLYRLDECARLGIDAAKLAVSGVLEQSRPASRLSLRVFVPEDRELRFLRDVLRERLRVSDRECVGEVVKGGADAVQEVSDQERGGISGRPLGLSEDAVRAGIRVVFVDEHVVLSAHPRIREGFEVFQVVQRPVQLQHVPVGGCHAR